MCMHSEPKVGDTQKNAKANEELKSERALSKLAKRIMLNVGDGIIESRRYKDWLKTQFPKYMFYSRVVDKVRIGVCECGGKSVVEKGRSGEYHSCPCCHEVVKLRDSRYPRVEDQTVVAVLSDGEGKGIVQRLYVVGKVTELIDDEIHTTTYEAEEQRDYISFENDVIYSIHPVLRWNYNDGEYVKDVTGFRNGPGKRHGQGWYAWRAEDRAMSVYPGNLSNLLNGTKYQYSALELASQKSKVNPLYYLRFYSNHPQLEMLYKAGLVKLADQLQQINNGWFNHEIGNFIAQAKTLKELFINNKMELEEAAKNNYGYEELRALSFVRKWNLLEAEKKRAIAFMKVVIGHSGDDFEYSFITNKSLFNYANKQITLERAAKVIVGRMDFDDDRDFRNFFSDYTDYISACIELDYNVNDTAISKPHEFKEMHDKIMAIQKYNKSHVYDVGVTAAWSNLHKFVDYTDGELSLVMAKTTDEIIKEGADLSHCVGRYCARVAKNESVICFIRRNEEPDKAYYTVELKPDVIKYDLVQVRGLNNKDPSEMVKTFLKKYEKWYNHREAKGYDEENLSATYFKAVRKNAKGEYVSIHDSKTKYRIGVETTVKADKNPDNVCVAGMHIASLDFAKNFGRHYKDAVILEVQVNIHDVIIPDAEDQVRCSRYKIIREVPYSELGEWGRERMKAAV